MCGCMRDVDWSGWNIGPVTDNIDLPNLGIVNLLSGMSSASLYYV
jgi:hypothetical protein